MSLLNVASIGHVGFVPALAAVAPSLSCLLRFQGPSKGLRGPWSGQTRRHTAAAKVRADPASKVTKHLKDFAKLPWELDMPAEQAAVVLGSYLGASNLEPAAVLDLDIDQITGILEETTNKGNRTLEKALFSHADAVTNRFFGPSVYYRGIVEFSNVCHNDCGYCGIRKHMHGVKRYTIPIPEVVEVAKWVFENRMGTIMLQSGELPTRQRLEYLKDLVKQVLEATIAMDLQNRGLDPKAPVPPELKSQELGLRAALSVGELPESDFQELYDAGARRYLLRLETSNSELYAALHPDAMSWQRRVDCLNSNQGSSCSHMALQQLLEQHSQTQQALLQAVQRFLDNNSNSSSGGGGEGQTYTTILQQFETVWGLETPQLLRDFAASVTAALPVGYCCNNPGCCNLDKLSELQLVAGSGKLCGQCRIARYCGPVCQKAHWKMHKAACRQLAAQAAARQK